MRCVMRHLPNAISRIRQPDMIAVDAALYSDQDMHYLFARLQQFIQQSQVSPKTPALDLLIAPQSTLREWMAWYFDRLTRMSSVLPSD